MYKITQNTLQNQSQNIPQIQQHNPQKFIQSYVIDYGKVIGQGNFSTVYAAINKNKPTERLAVKIININNMRAQKI